MIAFAYAVRCSDGMALMRTGGGRCTALQVVGCGLVPGLQYSSIVAAQACESRARGLYVAKRPELDLLLRLLRVDRIEVAMAAVRGWSGGCCVAVGYGDEGCASEVAGLQRPSDLDVDMDMDRIWRGGHGGGATPSLSPQGALELEEAALLNSRARPPRRQ